MRQIDRVWPHGILGQTYDTDEGPVHGKRDRYDLLDDKSRVRDRTGAGGNVTTRAQAEGAIEGTAADYRVSRPFDTQFRFSRYGAIAPMPPRAVLGGKLTSAL